MKMLKIQFITLFIISQLLLSSNTFALDLFGEDEDVIWEVGKNVYFKYAEQDDSKFGKNDHPAKLDVKDISLALESLEIWQKETVGSDEEPEFVFTFKQSRYLGEYLAKGLRNAKPEQDIIFALDKKSDRLFGLKTDTFYVAGRAFYKEGKLSIILGDYDRPRLEGYEAAYDPTHVGIVKYQFNHGSRSGNFLGTPFDKAVIKIPGVENKKFKKSRRDWFVIDVKLAAESYIAIKQARENPVTQRDKQFEIESAKLAKERREMRLELARIRKQMKESDGTNGQQGLSIEERLKKLDGLKQQDLISESEYDQQRNKILEEL